MMKVGVVGVPGGWSSDSLADVVEEKTGYRLLIDPEEICYVSSKQTVMYKDIDLMSLDGIIIKKIGPAYNPDLVNRLELLHFLQMKGQKLFSKPSSIVNSFNRLNGTLMLQYGSIPMPETIITESVEAAVEVIKDYGKAILKPLFSTKARGMVVAKAGDNDLYEKVETFKSAGNTSMYIQQMVDIPGKDLGVAFLGGEYLATYARVGSKESWNTTIHSGGRYEPYEPSQEIIDLAYRAQKLFDLDFTSVDVVETSDGPMVFEVSAFGGFRGLRDANGIDAADRYSSYVLEQLK